MSPEYLQDEKRTSDFYEQIIFYLPYSPMLKLPSIQKFVKRVMLSEINILTKL
jgi:hypothetical protein